MTEVIVGQDQVLEQVKTETESDISDAHNIITLLRILQT